MSNLFNFHNFLIILIAPFIGWFIGSLVLLPHRLKEPEPLVHTIETGLSLDVSKTYTALRISVLAGDAFDVVLDNNKRYFVKLVGSQGCPTEAQEQILKHINEAKKKGFAIKLTPYEWDSVSACWKVSLKINDESLLDWLILNNLTYRK